MLKSTDILYLLFVVIIITINNIINIINRESIVAVYSLIGGKEKLLWTMQVTTILLKILHN